MRKIPLLAALALTATLTLPAAGAPLPAHHCVYSGGGWLCSGGDPTDPFHRNDPAALPRLGGDDRYEVAATISAAFWEPAQTTTVYIAGGAAFADSTTAGASVDGPILLVHPDGTVPAATLAEIARLAPVTVVALGGPVSVTQAQLAAATAAGQ